MLKLHVKDEGIWKPVFCRLNGKIVTCVDQPQKALPPHSRWAKDDLEFFSSHFANHEFKLINVKPHFPFD